MKLDDLVLKQRQLSAISEGVRRDTYLTIEQVITHLGVSRATLEAYPVEILPFWDATPMSNRMRRRYSAADVLAAPILIRRWTEARAIGQGEAYLQERRTALRQREEQVLSQATEVPLT